VTQNIYITIYTKENGKQQFYWDEWFVFDSSRVTIHREDGPAMEYSEGSKHWFINGHLHREDGPAIEYSDGSNYWFLAGLRHREDGPAIEEIVMTGKLNNFFNLCWFLGGIEYTEREFSKIMKEVDQMDLVLQLTDPRSWVRKRAERLYKR